MKDYQERVTTERFELDEKYRKLDTFIMGELFDTLSTIDQILLIQQLNAMLLYSGLLMKRIQRFNNE